MTISLSTDHHLQRLQPHQHQWPRPLHLLHSDLRDDLPVSKQGCRRVGDVFLSMDVDLPGQVVVEVVGGRVDRG